ncbi:MAG TPA: hypothetical protein VGR58_10790 [Candidatus Acidoferrum sp.]|nr:hypothetical protein [Candidatus Acidoferrum sp.]
MNKASRVLLICSSSMFGLSCVGLLAGLIYTLTEYFRKGQAFDLILATSILFYQVIGALGILGFLFFFLFFLSLLRRPKKHDGS